MNGKFLDLVVRARTYRRFDEGVPIPETSLRTWVDCARLSPSAQNRQPLRYVIVSGKQKCNRVFPTLKWAAALPEWAGPAQGERPCAYLIICSKDANALTPIDVGIAAQSIKLAAQDDGFGSCMFKSFQKEQLARAIDLDTQEYAIELVIAFGVPAERVVVEPLSFDAENFDYWRDGEGVHHVPKYLLDDVIIAD